MKYWHTGASQYCFSSTHCLTILCVWIITKLECLNCIIVLSLFLFFMLLFVRHWLSALTLSAFISWCCILVLYYLCATFIFTLYRTSNVQVKRRLEILCALCTKHFYGKKCITSTLNIVNILECWKYPMRNIFKWINFQ